MNKGFQVLDQYWCRHTSPHEVSGAQCLSRRLILAVFELVFVFRLGGPTPSEAAGGRPLTQRSKTLGPGAGEVTLPRSVCQVCIAHAHPCVRARPPLYGRLTLGADGLSDLAS